jgi:arabinan endo-1,5-alpha-L-arabinosidase
VRTPEGEVRGGAFSWPTQNADLSRDQNDASVLLKDAPQGDYTVETKLTIDLGEDTDRSYSHKHAQIRALKLGLLGVQ